ncbi:asparagine synthase-domain-containing protein [Sordaria sp. MPI-SDFR-AT-0083]|nr:asparagine synthase-domain-containing protein [Sordaria sp. MPI-SDFR-AT-0083]
MCGIHAVLTPPGIVHTISPDLTRCLCNRGPDYLGQVERRVTSTSCSSSSNSVSSLSSLDSCWTLKLTSTVLALRGDHVAKQPLTTSYPDADTDKTGSVLCWNGEAWRINGEPVKGNDGEEIWRLLREAEASASATVAAAAASEEEEEEEKKEKKILDVFRVIEGPFAFVYWYEAGRKVIFGRDRLGRRSLMAKRDERTGEVVLSSVAEGFNGGSDNTNGSNGWKEVEADGIYVLDLGLLPLSGEDATPAALDPVRRDWIEGVDPAEFVSSIGRFNKSLPPASSYAPLSATSPSVLALKQQLIDSLSLRVLNIPRPPNADRVAHDTRVAVLFSGGLDCTVLARLAHEVMDPEQGIDLLNVAFENPRVVAQLRKDHAKNKNKKKNSGNDNGNDEVDGDNIDIDFYEACPDRITGRKSFAELQRVCRGRAFRFVAVNVPYTETLSHRQQVISLIYPHNTEMDLSIGYALYFAARAQGACTHLDGCVEEEYSSPARVLLSGLGADELFGGYSRHPSAYERAGYAGLVDELLLDVGRLGKRNLGRDDRAMSHWSKEVRFPFLDERLVRWAMNTPAWEKCDFENEGGEIEAGKRVLRLLALELGMEGVAKEKKRAIQFGARTAKMESGRVKGTTLIS